MKCLEYQLDRLVGYAFATFALRLSECLGESGEATPLVLGACAEWRPGVDGGLLVDRLRAGARRRADADDGDGARFGPECLVRGSFACHARLRLLARHRGHSRGERQRHADQIRGVLCTGTGVIWDKDAPDYNTMKKVLLQVRNTKSKKDNEEIIIVQIAGLIARRIVCEAEQGQELNQGDRIGMIRFGSRVDMYFKNKKVLAKIGQNVVAGESLIASE